MKPGKIIASEASNKSNDPNEIINSNISVVNLLLE